MLRPVRFLTWSDMSCIETQEVLEHHNATWFPADVRRRLGLVQGSVVHFCMDEEGVRLIPAVGDVRRLKGRVPVPPQPVTQDITRCQTTARACALV